MERHIFLNALLVLFFHASALSQPMIEVFTGLHYPTTLSQEVGSNLLEKFWKPSLDVSVRSNVQVSKWLNLTPSVSYNHYLFNSYYREGNFVDSEWVFAASSGEGSDILRIMVELQAIDQSESLAQPYVDVGGGYVAEKMGTIHGRIEYLKYLAYSKDLHVSDDSYFAYTIGVGGMLSLSASLRLDFSIKDYSNTTGRSYILFSLAIGYRLLN